MDSEVNKWLKNMITNEQDLGSQYALEQNDEKYSNLNYLLFTHTSIISDRSPLINVADLSYV